MAWYRFLKLAASEAKVNFLAQRYKLPPQEVQKLIQYDVSNRGVFLEWIVKQVTLKQLRFPEDGQKLTERLQQFSKLKNSPRFTAPKDINQYKTFGDLAETIDRSSGSASKNEQFRVQSESGAEVVLENGEYTVMKITTPEASAKWCKGTEWCVKDPEYFKEYGMGPNSPTYLFMKNGKKTALLHVHSNQFMDAYDRSVTLEFVKEAFMASLNSEEVKNAVGRFILNQVKDDNYRSHMYLGILLEKRKNLGDVLSADLALQLAESKEDEGAIENEARVNPLLNDVNFWRKKMDELSEKVDNSWDFATNEFLSVLYSRNTLPAFRKAWNDFFDELVNNVDKYKNPLKVILHWYFGPGLKDKIAPALSKVMKKADFYSTLSSQTIPMVRSVLGSNALQIMLQNKLLPGYAGVNANFTVKALKLGYTAEEVKPGLDMLYSQLAEKAQDMEQQGWNLSLNEVQARDSYIHDFWFVAKFNYPMLKETPLFTLCMSLSEKLKAAMDVVIKNKWKQNEKPIAGINNNSGVANNAVV